MYGKMRCPEEVEGRKEPVVGEGVEGRKELVVGEGEKVGNGAGERWVGVEVDGGILLLKPGYSRGRDQYLPSTPGREDGN